MVVLALAILWQHLASVPREKGRLEVVFDHSKEEMVEMCSCWLPLAPISEIITMVDMAALEWMAQCVVKESLWQVLACDNCLPGGVSWFKRASRPELFLSYLSGLKQTVFSTVNLLELCIFS